MKGMTLVELLISVAGLVIIATLLTVVFSRALQTGRIARARASLELECKRALDETILPVKEAVRVENTLSVLGQSYTSDQDTLVLSLPSVDANQQILPTGETDAVVVFIEDSRLRKIVAPHPASSRAQTNKVLTVFLNQFALEYLDETENSTTAAQAVAVEAQVNCQRQQDGRDLNFKVSSQGRLRNK